MLLLLGPGFDPWSGNQDPTSFVVQPKKKKSKKKLEFHKAHALSSQTTVNSNAIMAHRGEDQPCNFLLIYCAHTELDTNVSLEIQIFVEDLC